MKKDQRKKIILPITGKDEMNLCECPFTLLADKNELNQKTLEFTDRQNRIIRNWKVMGSAEYGLPCALDEPVFIALLALTKQQGFKNQKIFFNRLEMLKLMNWPIDGPHYSRLGLAFSRLNGVTIETNYLWDQGEFKKGKFTLNIISESFLYQGKKKNTKNSWFEWGNRIFKSFQVGNIKSLNLETYFSLKTPTSKRLYRLWDKRLYKTNQLSFDLKDLCHEKLGISRNLIYPSLLKQALSPALKEHKAKNLLLSTGFIKDKNGNWLLTIKKYKENSRLLPAPLMENLHRPKDDPILKKLLFLKIPTKKAKILLQTYSKEIIKSWIMAIDIVKPIPTNKAGYLLKALEEKWELPEAVRNKKEGEQREKEEKLRAEYNKFVIVKVDEYLKTLDTQYVKEEIEKFRKVFMLHWGLDTISSVWLSRLQNDFKYQKAKTLNLPTFEEWKK